MKTSDLSLALLLTVEQIYFLHKYLILKSSMSVFNGLNIFSLLNEIKILSPTCQR